jgi:hypothetical protein
MSSSLDAITLTLLAVVAVLVAGIVAYAAKSRLQARRKQRNIIAIRATIIDYFRRSGVEVSADCTDFRGNGAYVAIVESEPMKRFRLSHIIEMTLREHVRKACDLELDKIYWRFPIKEAAQSAPGGSERDDDRAGTAATKPAQPSDDYINEGLEHYRHIPKPEVEELPWESFEQVTTGAHGARADTPESGAQPKA